MAEKDFEINIANCPIIFGQECSLMMGVRRRLKFVKGGKYSLLT